MLELDNYWKKLLLKTRIVKCQFLQTKTAKKRNRISIMCTHRRQMEGSSCLVLYHQHLQTIKAATFVLAFVPSKTWCMMNIITNIYISLFLHKNNVLFCVSMHSERHYCCKKEIYQIKDNWDITHTKQRTPFMVECFVNNTRKRLSPTWWWSVRRCDSVQIASNSHVQ